MKRLFSIFYISLLFVCNKAIADQCAYIDVNTKDRAYNILKSTEVYIDFCAPCEDSVPIENKISKLEYKKVDYIENNTQYYQIYINNEPIDLAYVYVDGRNLGILTNCKIYGDGVQNVPEYINDHLTGNGLYQKNPY